MTLQVRFYSKRTLKPSYRSISTWPRNNKPSHRSIWTWPRTLKPSYRSISTWPRNNKPSHRSIWTWPRTLKPSYRSISTWPRNIKPSHRSIWTWPRALRVNLSFYLKNSVTVLLTVLGAKGSGDPHRSIESLHQGQADTTQHSQGEASNADQGTAITLHRKTTSLKIEHWTAWTNPVLCTKELTLTGFCTA